MTDAENTFARPLVVGANHRSSSMSIRDRLFVEDAQVPGVLEKLRAQGIAEAVVVSTCDRVEIQCIHNEFTSHALFGRIGTISACDR